MLDAFNLYLTQPNGNLSRDGLDTLQIASDDEEFVIAPPEFVEVMRVYPSMFKQYATRFNAATSDSEMPLQGKRDFRPHKVSSQVKISKNVLGNGKESPCEVVADRLAYWLREAEEKEFLLGTGQGECTGLFTPSEVGISPQRDCITAHDLSLTGDDFKGAMMMLEPQYRANARWILHVDTVRLAEKLTDSHGQPIYRGATANQTPTIAGAPFIMMDDAPNKVASGQYMAVLGDLSWYGIAETMEFRVHATVEPDPAIKKNTYIGRTSIDGMPLREEAFVRLKMA